MKKIVMLLSLLVLGTGLLSAAEDSLTLKGKLTITNRIHPELSANGKVYELLIPRNIVDELNDGEEISVEGVKAADMQMPGKRNFFATTETKTDRNFVKVNKITARGKTLDVEKEFGDCGACQGKGPGSDDMMGGRRDGRPCDGDGMMKMKK